MILLQQKKKKKSAMNVLLGCRLLPTHFSLVGAEPALGSLHPASPMVPQEREELLSSTKHKVPATVQGTTELSGPALDDVDAQCCCQAAWDPGWRQALGRPFLVSWGCTVRRNLRVLHPFLKQPDSWFYRQAGGLSRQLLLL